MKIRRLKYIFSLFLLVVFAALFISFTLSSFSNIENAIDTNTTDGSKVLGDVSEEAVVKRVIDGDTIEIDTGEKVRYIGIDTPEDPLSENSECFALNSFLKNKELVLGKKIRMEKDVSDTDKYGRLLRYVYVGDTFVNLEMVERGYAVASAYPPDTKYSDLFLDAEFRANSNNIGIWGSCYQGNDKQYFYFINEILNGFSISK